MDKRFNRQPTVTHVAALVFCVNGSQVTFCVLLPTAACKDRQFNLTIPGGPLHQVGSRNFRSPEESLQRRLVEEVGISAEDIRVMARVTEPIDHRTASNTPKRFQCFVVIVDKECCAPRLSDKIEQVLWPKVEASADLINMMHARKQQLVQRLLIEVRELEEVYPCVKRAVANLLEPQLELRQTVRA